MQKKISRVVALALFLFHLPDLLLAFYFYSLYLKRTEIEEYTIIYIAAGLLVYYLLRIVLMALGGNFFYSKRVRFLKSVIEQLRKGRFFLQDSSIDGDDGMALVLKELLMVGRHLDSVVTAQREEIDKFHELYQNIVFSISSYFVVMDDESAIVFANEGFCNKFQFDVDDIAGKNIEEVFYFVNARLKGGIEKVKKEGTSVILEKTHLLSVNKVSIIADIKISNILVQGRRQIILIIDDVTSKLRKDYQISLLSQISESIQSDVEIERVLYTILTGVTSGSGLGFNRAMLFLVSENGKSLEGKMAVGPDSFEEAIHIWSSAPSIPVNINSSEEFQIESGRELLRMVLDAAYSLNDDNVLARSFMTKDFIHVYDSYSDDSVGEDIRSLLDVKEFVVVPIVAVNRSIGVIIVDNKFNQVPIGNDSIELLTIFASQAALSIESFNSLVAVKREMDKISRKQEAIVESEKMAAVGRIAAHIAHEIRNPLVTMGGYARRIVQQAKTLAKESSKSGDNIIKAGTIIMRESERLEKILSNVMDFTRPSKYIKEFSNINDVVNDTVELLKNLFLEKKIQITFHADPDLPLVKSDFNQIKQVVLNLIQNSIDATSMGGAITIITKALTENVLLKVQDTGSGIEEEDPSVVFEPFFTTKVTGVGLGLANVKKIIKDHNGTIEVANREDGGAEFIVTLPIS